MAGEASDPQPVAPSGLTAALDLVTDRRRVQVVIRSYELAPGESRNPGPTAAEAMTGWWGDQAGARKATIESLGAAEGLSINLHRARPVNTFDAHRLCHLAADRDRADEMLEQLLRAYHTDGLNIADPQVLQRLGGAAGLADTEVHAVLVGDDYAEDVRADRRRGVEHGVTGVPTLVIDGGPPVSVIQPVAQLRRLFE
ncbi:DSBA oxidoreductase [Actinoplanes utahensis]|uniref:DSBA oxidoreductase n=1 Tax=Actinoplanes utahensis TaxID=1869 RepID=A0A0A6UGA8_ACTUT|nr:DSBA oxidoreductase [Actinoplanes utahensis]